MEKPRNNYRDMRKRAQITPESASTALDVSISTLFSWERGTTSPNAEKLAQMARLYGCSADELLGLVVCK